MNFDIIIDRCKEEMNTKNLTIRDVAKLSKISEPTIYRMMNAEGQNMSVATLEAVCTALNVDVYTGTFEVKEGPPYDYEKEAVYQARIRDLKLAIAEKDMWIKRLFVAIAIIIAFLLMFLAIDFLNPNVGWVRAAAMIGMQYYL